MSREIKFRAWDLENKKLLKCTAVYDDMSCRVKDDAKDRHIAIKKCELMQYTGLKDKNGVEIYEGDILARVFDDYNEPCIVVYEQGILSAKPMSKNYYRPLNTKACKTSCRWCHADCGSSGYDFKVIGNIYENGDLLK